MPKPTNETLWTGGHPYSYRGFLYILSPAVVYSARVNQASFEYPLLEVTYDAGSGTLANVHPGMMITFGESAGSASKGWQIISDTPTETLFKFGWSSQGDLEGEVDLSDNLFITVYDFYPGMHKLLRIEPDGTIYKFGYQDFATYGAVTPPVSNSGIYYAGFVNEDDEIEVDFVGSHSYTTDPTADGELTHLWDFVDGTPDTSTSANPTGIVFPIGKRNVRHTVTDSNGKTHTSIVHVAALEQPGGTFAPIVDFDVTQNKVNQTGHSMSFFVKEDIPIEDYPIGTLVIYFEEEFFGDAYTGSLPGITQPGREHVKFVGFLESASEGVRGSREGAIRDCTIQCVDFMGRGKAITSREQELEHVDVPATWTQMVLPNMDRYFHYLLYWHSTLLEITDFTWSGLGAYYPFPRLNSDKANLYDQVNVRAKAIQHLFTSDSRGRLFIRPDLLNLDLAGDSAATVATRTASSSGLMSLTEDHYTKFEQSDKRPSVGVLNGSGIRADTYTTEPLFCYSPGRAPGVGANESEAGRRLVYNQAELNAQNGHMYKRANAPENLWNMDLMQGGDGGFEPGLLDLVLATRNTPWIPQRGRTVNNARYLVTELNIRHSNDHQMTKFQSLTLEKETIGIPAATVAFPAIGETPNPVPSQPTNPPYPYGGNDEIPYFVINPIFTPPPTYNPIPPNPPTLPAGTVVIRSASDMWISTKYRTESTLARLAWKKISIPVPPGSLYQPVDFQWESGGTGGYATMVIAEFEGENNTLVYNTDNPLANNPWILGAELEGTFGLIAVPNTADALYVYGSAGETAWDYLWDFVEPSGDTPPANTEYGDGGFAQLNPEINSGGTYVDGTGWDDTVDTSDSGRKVRIGQEFVTAGTYTAISILYNMTIGTGGEAPPANSVAIRAYYLGVLVGSAFKNSANGNDQSLTLTLDNELVDEFDVRLWASDGGSEGSVLLKRITATGTGNNPFGINDSNAVTRYSTNRGDSFASEVIVGPSPATGSAIDTIKIIPGVLANAENQVRKTTSAGGSYSDYGSPTTYDTTCLIVPRYKVGTTNTNNAITSPDYVTGISSLLATDTIFYITDGGTTVTPITPEIESVVGRALHTRCMAMPWVSGKKLAALLRFGSTNPIPVHLMTMDDLGDGDTWTDRGELETGSPIEQIAFRRGDKAAKELYFVAGGRCYYSPDFGATILEREVPVDLEEDGIIGIAVYG